MVVVVVVVVVVAELVVVVVVLTIYNDHFLHNTNFTGYHSYHLCFLLR